MNPTPLPAGESKQGDERRARLVGLNHAPAVVAERTRAIYATVLERSKYVGSGNFTAIAPNDLRLLFDLYDAAFFDGLLDAMLRADRAELSFRLSRRMTRVAGTTTHLRERSLAATQSSGADRYEIAVSTTLLFGTFRDVDRPVTVGVGTRSGWLVDLRGRTLEPVDGSFGLRPFGIATFRCPG